MLETLALSGVGIDKLAMLAGAFNNPTAAIQVSEAAKSVYHTLRNMSIMFQAQ